MNQVAPCRSMLALTWMLALAALLPAHARAGASAHVALADQVQVRRPEVLLGDVAQLRSGDLDTLRQLMSLSIGPAPRAGDAVVLDRRMIARFAQARLRVAEGAIEWEGAQSVRIERATQSIAGDRLVGAAREQLDGWLRGRYQRFSLAATQDVSVLQVPAGDVEVRARELPDNLLPTRRMVVWLDVWVGGVFVRTVPVSFEVSVYQQGWVAQRDVRAGETLQASAFEPRVIDIARAGGVPLAVVPEGGRVRHTVLAATPLLAAAVEAAPAVVRGQTVVLRSHMGAIALEARAEVLQDGWRGGHVRVRMPAAKDSIMARVIDGGHVELVQ
ncbi:flagellar basal body P-ring formation chaperone FlgA [Cupriavidus sp. 30B13]|uniref:flagellar basal body P-ring formation chaperone FlgA n=1 Tax=Cupriavidus sp. 30B13 TaxID=3384241 RepID=UPI003B91664E